MESAIAEHSKSFRRRPPRLRYEGLGKMVVAMVTGRLKALRRTKLYDLFAAAPLIAWYAFCAAQMLPSLAQQVALVKLFVRTDPSVLPATLVFSTVSQISTLVFLVVLVV